MRGTEHCCPLALQEEGPQQQDSAPPLPPSVHQLPQRQSLETPYLPHRLQVGPFLLVIQLSVLIQDLPVGTAETCWAWGRGREAVSFLLSRCI